MIKKIPCLVLFAFAGCIYREPPPIPVTPPAPPTASDRWQEFKDADPRKDVVIRAYRIKDIEWEISPSHQTGATLTVELTDDSNALGSFMAAFMHRGSIITGELFPQVKDLAKEWLASDRKGEVVKTAGSRQLTFSGHEVPGSLRLELALKDTAPDPDKKQ